MIFGKTRVVWPMIGALLFFGVLWLLDFPKPSYDDLFQAGAAFHMAEGGDFSNPLIERQEFPSHYFFVYPPLNSYLLAGWLKVFGINAASVTAYPICSCMVICVATILVLRRHQASVWLQWFVPLGVSFGILYMGLRPEPMAVALAMTGFAITDSEAGRKNGVIQWLGFFLMIMGASAAPRVTLFVGALVVYALYRGWRDKATKQERWNVVFRWLGAGAATGLLFLVMIGFRVAEFLHTFHFHAAGRISNDKVWVIKQYLFGYLGYLQLTILLMPLVLLAWVLRKPKDELSRPALWVAAMAPVAFCTGGIGSGTAWWAFLVMILLAGSLVKTLSRKGAIALQVCIFLILVVINRKVAAECWGIVSGHITRDQGQQMAEAKAIQPTPEHPVLLDGWVARYLYDYRLPKGVIDAEWSVRFPGAGPGSYATSGDAGPQLRKGDIFVVCNYMRHSLQTYTLLEKTTDPLWRAFGLKQLAFDPYPRVVYIIPAEDCKDVRPGAAQRVPGS
ncbi:MAG TPA: hypothetical protein VG754_02950 [Verrucomicrobiae bacterium]|nr:hypothetical protein [Verrucomicrobiae bacterium]